MGGNGASTAASIAQKLFGGNGSGSSGGGLNLGGILGGLAGGALGTVDGSKQAGETTSTVAPWGPQQQYLLQGFEQAKTNLAQQQGQGNPLLDPAQAEMLKTIQGGYLDPNNSPYMDDVIKSGQAKTQAQMSGLFSGDSFGSSAHQQWLQRGQDDTALGYLDDYWKRERGNMLTAAGGAPGFSQGYFGAQNAPLNNYMNTVGQGYGKSVTEPYYTNPLLGGLSGAAAGSLLGSSFFG